MELVKIGNNHERLLQAEYSFKIKKAIKSPLRTLFLIIELIIKARVVNPAKSLIDYKIWPYLNFGVIFSHTKKDVMTQMGSGEADAYLLTDPTEVSVHH